MSKRTPEFEQSRTNHSSQGAIFEAQDKQDRLTNTSASRWANLDTLKAQLPEDKPTFSISVAFKFLLKYWGSK